MTRLIILIIFLVFQVTSNAQVALELDFSNPKEVNNLIGFNTGFDHRHWVEKVNINGNTNYTDSIRQDILLPMLDINTPILRFPGGVIANFYHLYTDEFDCSIEEPCIEDFALGYGLRQNEVATFNNGFGSVSAEYNFEQNSNNVLSNNWIVTFADMLDAYKAESGVDVEVIYMANVLSHFKFGSQASQFDGNFPQIDSESFKESLQETEHALKYLIEVRGINVTKLEMGTELYFQTWLNNNEVTIDRFIELIPIYRALLDNLNYLNIEIGVPFYHKHDLSANADNWSRKLADQSYHSNMMFDDWIIHDYQRMVDPCTVVLGNCNQCNNWDDDECTLYNGNTNILNCEPDNHAPTSEELEHVYQLKNERFSEAFNGGLAINYKQTLDELRALSGKTSSKLWMTEWNQVFDAGCDKWKGINKFFPNTFAHGVNIFEILHSMYEENAKQDNQFMEVATFHTFSAPNIIYAIINARSDVTLNATFYPFQMASMLHKLKMKKVEATVTGEFDHTDLNLHAYKSELGDSIEHTLIYFSNKTLEEIDLKIPSVDTFTNSTVRFVTAEALHSSIDSEYFFKTANVTVSSINAEFAEMETDVDGAFVIPAMSYGYFHIELKSPVSINPVSGFKQIKIYPNPSIDLITINDLPGHHVELTMYNSLGALVYNSMTVSIHHDVDISGFQKGAYVLRIKDRTHTESKKFIKL